MSLDEQRDVLAALFMADCLPSAEAYKDAQLCLKAAQEWNRPGEYADQLDRAAAVVKGPGVYAP